MEPDHTDQATDNTPQTPGPILRRCREFHAITLEDAAQATKIGKNYLRALEEDRYQDFASPAYLKGFLKIYAQHLGLNPDDLLQLLESDVQPEEAAPQHQELATDLNRPFWQRLALPALLFAVIVVLALMLRPSEQPPVRPQAPPAQVAAIQKPQSSSQLPPSPATAAAPTGEVQQAAAPLVPASGVTVRMKALRKGSLVVTMDDTATQAYELTGGDQIEWRADRTISLELSDPASVELELNGKPFKPAMQPGKSATLTLDANGIRP